MAAVSANSCIFLFYFVTCNDVTYAGLFGDPFSALTWLGDSKSIQSVSGFYGLDALHQLLAKFLF